MAVFAGHILAEQAVGETQEGHQRQRPADRAARHLQRDGEQRDRDRHLEAIVDEAVLVGQRLGVERDVEAADLAEDQQHPAGEELRAGLGQEDEEPGQRQRHVDRPGHQRRHETAEDQSQMEGDGEQPEQRPDEPHRRAHGRVVGYHRTHRIILARAAARRVALAGRPRQRCALPGPEGSLWVSGHGPGRLSADRRADRPRLPRNSAPRPDAA